MTNQNTNWKELLINGRAPREGEPGVDEYTRRFTAWAGGQDVTVRPWGDPQIEADYWRAAR